jgi:hypothetical protein
MRIPLEADRTFLLRMIPIMLGVVVLALMVSGAQPSPTRTRVSVT